MKRWMKLLLSLMAIVGLTAPGVATMAAAPGAAPAEPPLPHTLTLPKTAATARLIARRSPPGGPPAGVQDVVFSDALHGIAVTGSSLTFQTAPGEIAVTSNGGSTWQAIWRRTDAALYWIGRVSDGTWLAAGQIDTKSGSPLPLLLTSTDGRRWSGIHPVLPTMPLPSGPVLWWTLRFTFPTKEIGFAVPDPKNQATFGLGGILRTTDGGRHWALVRLPGGQPSGGIAFVNPTVGFATGYAQGQGGCTGLWRTIDTGASWQPMKDSCALAGATSLSFASGTTGYAGGGRPPKFGGVATLWRTVDGGHMWQRIFQASAQTDGPISAIVVHGTTLWALEGECTGGQNGPCGGAVAVSHTGGRSFTRLGAAGVHISAPDAFTAFVATPPSSVIWHITKTAGGRYVRSSARRPSTCSRCRQRCSRSPSGRIPARSRARTAGSITVR